MKRHTCRIGGTLALAAMTLFLVETVWASTCAPGMDMSDLAMALDDHGSPPPDDCMHGWKGHGTNEEDGDDDRPCPFGHAASAQTCAGITTMPARAMAALAPSPEGVTAVFLELTKRDLLLGAALFHPPRS
jgi:hypothetical protein